MKVMLLVALLSSASYAKTIKVAILDSGIRSDVFANKKANKLCNTGHKDFTNTSMSDSVLHGTNIAGLIKDNAEETPFCEVIVKVFANQSNNDVNCMVKALRYVIDLQVDVINISGGGEESSYEERALIIEALDKGIKVVASAGNLKSDLSRHPYYPAMYDKRIIVVGSGKSSSQKASYSNYGDGITSWQDGTNKEAYGLTATGTSQAAAIRTGKLVKELYVQSRRYTQSTAIYRR